MPMFEYACQQCNHTFEALVLNGEQVDCPECHSEKLQQLLSVPAKPRSESSMPMMCDPSTPPCGAMCRKTM